MIGGTNCGAGGEPAPKSNVIVTTTESELVGKNVTFEQGTKTLTKAFTDSKQVVFTTKEMGIVSITCEEISKSVNVATLGVDYNVSLKRTRVVITTESDDLVGQTVTLKKNDTTIESKVFTSAKSLTFIVSTIGIYTAYCGDYEVDVNVTALGSTYTGEIVPITEVTVTVNGGALETITITDTDGTSQTVTTNSSGTTVATLNTSKTYTFCGGVSGYSVQKTITEETTVNVMPSNTIYWYGSGKDNISTSGWVNNSGAECDFGNSSFQTNYINFARGSSGKQVSFGTKTAINLTNYANAKVISNSSGANVYAFYATTSKTRTGQMSSYLFVPTQANVTETLVGDVSGYSGNYYLSTNTGASNVSSKFYALWLETSTKTYSNIYGSASETISIYKGSTLIGTVKTDTSGSAMADLMDGTYKFVGSVSGYEKTATITSHSDVYVMARGGQ